MTLFRAIQLVILASLWCSVVAQQQAGGEALWGAGSPDAVALVQQAGAMRVREGTGHNSTKACVEVSNGDFELGTLGQIPTGWMRYASYGSTGLLVNGEKHSGGMTIEFEGAGWELIENGPTAEFAWSFTSGVTYTLTMWAKTNSGTGYKLRTQFLVYDGFTPESSYLRQLGGVDVITYDVPTDGWGQLSQTFTPTETSTNVRMNIGLTWDSPDTGSIFVDTIAINCGEALWIEVDWSHTKCNTAEVKVSSQHVCQELAVAAGHSYYQYYDGTGSCATAASCDSPIIGTEWAWKVYAGPTMSPTASPTASPTTAIPTAAPTVSPTMSPTAAANLVGDPHITTAHGDRFDTHLTGNVTLLRIPKLTDAEPLLKLTGLLHNADPKCQAGTYLIALHVDGSWMPQRRVFYPSPRRGVHRRKQHISVGPKGIRIVVVHGETETGVPYLNLRVNNLGQLGLPVGGLLGGDIPEGKLGMPAECA